MNRLMSAAKSFLKSDSGPTAVEYGVLLALIVVTVIAAITLLGQKAANVFDGVSDELEGE